MSQIPHPRLVSKDGTYGTVRGVTPHHNNTEMLLVVDFDHGQRILVPMNSVNRQQDGSYYLPYGIAELKAGNEHISTIAGDKVMVLPIIEEEIEVGRRVVETGKVRLTKHVNQWEEEINESVLQEEVEIERVPVNRLIDAPADIRNEGGTTIIPVMEEVLVVEKRIRLKEEVHITLRRTTSLETQRVTVRKEEVDVERVPGNGSDRV